MSFVIGPFITAVKTYLDSSFVEFIEFTINEAGIIESFNFSGKEPKILSFPIKLFVYEPNKEVYSCLVIEGERKPLIRFILETFPVERFLSGQKPQGATHWIPTAQVESDGNYTAMKAQFFGIFPHQYSHAKFNLSQKSVIEQWYSHFKWHKEELELQKESQNVVDIPKNEEILDSIFEMLKNISEQFPSLYPLNYSQQAIVKRMLYRDWLILKNESNLREYQDALIAILQNKVETLPQNTKQNAQALRSYFNVSAIQQFEPNNFYDKAEGISLNVNVSDIYRFMQLALKLDIANENISDYMRLTPPTSAKHVKIKLASTAEQLLPTDLSSKEERYYSNLRNIIYIVAPDLFEVVLFDPSNSEVNAIAQMEILLKSVSREDTAELIAVAEVISTAESYHTLPEISKIVDYLAITFSRESAEGIADWKVTLRDKALPYLKINLALKNLSDPERFIEAKASLFNFKRASSWTSCQLGGEEINYALLATFETQYILHSIEVEDIKSMMRERRLDFAIIEKIFEIEPENSIFIHVLLDEIKKFSFNQLNEEEINQYISLIKTQNRNKKISDLLDRLNGMTITIQVKNYLDKNNTPSAMDLNDLFSLMPTIEICQHILRNLEEIHSEYVIQFMKILEGKLLENININYLGKEFIIQQKIFEKNQNHLIYGKNLEEWGNLLALIVKEKTIKDIIKNLNPIFFNLMNIQVDFLDFISPLQGLLKEEILKKLSHNGYLIKNIWKLFAHHNSESQIDIVREYILSIENSFLTLRYRGIGKVCNFFLSYEEITKVCAECLKEPISFMSLLSLLLPISNGKRELVVAIYKKREDKESRENAEQFEKILKDISAMNADWQSLPDWFEFVFAFLEQPETQENEESQYCLAQLFSFFDEEQKTALIRLFSAEQWNRLRNCPGLIYVLDVLNEEQINLFFKRMDKDSIPFFYRQDEWQKIAKFKLKTQLTIWECLGQQFLDIASAKQLLSRYYPFIRGRSLDTLVEVKEVILTILNSYVIPLCFLTNRIFRKPHHKEAAMELIEWIQMHHNLTGTQLKNKVTESLLILHSQRSRDEKKGEPRGRLFHHLLYSLEMIEPHCHFLYIPTVEHREQALFQV